MATIQFNGEMTEEQIEVLQKAGYAMADHINQQISQFKIKHPECSDHCAMDVVYLRTRSRHTPELEARLIREHAEGKTINIYDWP